MIAIAKGLRLLDDDDLAHGARALPDVALAGLIRELEDEQLVALFTAATPAPAKATRGPKRAPPHRAPKETPVPRKKKEGDGRSNRELGASTEKVLAVLRGADGEIPPSAIIEKTGFSAPTVRAALVTLQSRGLVEHNGGKTTGSRWSLKL